MPPTPAKLSCEQCRQRKTKCDKQTPCTACKHAGISCTAVQRARLPRGRAVKSQKKNDRLENRLEQLESLIKQLESQVKPDGTILPPPIDASRPPLDKLEAFVARDFWVELSQEVAGLRDTLEESSDDCDDDGDSPQQESPSPFWGSPSDALLTGRSPSTQHSVEPPAEPLRRILLDIYQQRVDPLFKAVHWPSTVAAIDAQYATQGTDGLPATVSASVRALEFAIYFLVICSMNDDECRKILHSDRVPLLQQFRLGTEIYVSRGKFLYSPDMTVLQAFVIYLLGLRTCKESALSWTLLASAVRVATALRLPANEPEGRSTLELEVGRRVWFCIGVLDSQTAFDRGYPPITSLEDFAKQPKIINDSQLAQHSAEQATRDPFTDMSFMYVLQEATICLRKLVAPPKATVGDEDPWADWKTGVRTIAAFEDAMKQHRIRIGASKKPMARFTEFSTEHISLNLHLLLRRPPYRRKYSPVPPWDDFNLLEATTNAMERIARKDNDPAFAPYIWFSRSWVEWNALAILLAELCSPREDALATRAYRVAQVVYDLYRKEMSGPDSQMLWRPIARLMRRVHKVRGRGSVSDYSSSGPETSTSPPSYFNMEASPQDVAPNQSQPVPVDTQMADMTVQPRPLATTGPAGQDMPMAPWFSEADNWQPMVGANIAPGGDMASWLSWDNFLGDMYSGTPGATMNAFNPGTANQ